MGLEFQEKGRRPGVTQVVHVCESRDRKGVSGGVGQATEE